jgi:hypothetical protein
MQPSQVEVARGSEDVFIFMTLFHVKILFSSLTSSQSKSFKEEPTHL